MSKIFFITGIGTDIGKSFILQKLCREFIVRGEKFQAIKPIISGFDPKDPNSDSAKILSLLAKENNQQNLDDISPWRFSHPVSPNIAAQLVGTTIDFAAVVDFCLEKIIAAKKDNHYLLIEGAGGVMTPINNQKTFADLIAALQIPAILVVSDYLGAISHSLTAIKAMESYKIAIAKIIFNTRNPDQSESQMILQTLKNFTDINIDIVF